MFNDRNYIASVKRRFPEGTRIVLDFMSDDPHPVEAGTKGTVLHVDDIGTIHCLFDNGRQLGLVPGEDYFHKIAPKDRGDAR